MTKDKRSHRRLLEGVQSASVKEMQDAKSSTPSEHGGLPTDTFPPFDDPAFSAVPAKFPAVDPTCTPHSAPQDPIFAGHPEFSQDAAKNKPPRKRFDNSEAVKNADEKTRHSDGQQPRHTARAP